jgi:hypothetical protein
MSAGVADDCGKGYLDVYRVSPCCFGSSRSMCAILNQDQAHERVRSSSAVGKRAIIALRLKRQTNASLCRLPGIKSLGKCRDAGE